MLKKDCLFCKIINREENAYIVYENDKVCCFLDIDPINIGHTLIVSKEHYLDVDELDSETAIEIMKTSILVVQALKEIFQVDGYSIMQNGGCFNDIGHYHMHVFPRYIGDGFGWTYREEDKEGYSEEELYQKLKSVLNN